MATADVINLFFERVGSGNADAVAELFADQIDWFVPGHDAIPSTGSRSKRSDVATYLRTMWPELEPGKSSIRVDEILVDGDDAVVFVNVAHTFSRTRRSFSTPAAMHFSVSDGKLVKMHLYEDTDAVATAFLDRPVCAPPEH